MGLVGAGGVESRKDVDLAGRVGDHIGTVAIRRPVIQHVKQRQPGDALVYGILDRADVVLVLFVQVVEREIGS